MYKAVFHVNANDTTPLNQGLNNVSNLLISIQGQEHDLIMLFNGPAVALLAGEACKPFQERIRDLHGKGIRFLICRNALNKFEVNPEQLINVCEIIPAGITALIDLQNDGFAYIKP